MRVNDLAVIFWAIAVHGGHVSGSSDDATGQLAADSEEWHARWRVEAAKQARESNPSKALASYLLAFNPLPVAHPGTAHGAPSHMLSNCRSSVQGVSLPLRIKKRIALPSGLKKRISLPSGIKKRIPLPFGIRKRKKNGVIQLENSTDFLTKVEEAKEQDKVVVIAWTQAKCRACQAMKIKYKQIVQEADYEQEVEFCEFPLSRGSKQLAKDQGIKSLPFVEIYLGNKGRVEAFPCGPSKIQKLKDYLKIYADGAPAEVEPVMA